MNMTLSDIVMDRPETKKVMDLLPHLPAVFEFGLMYVLTENPDPVSDFLKLLSLWYHIIGDTSVLCFNVSSVVGMKEEEEFIGYTDFVMGDAATIQTSVLICTIY